MSKSETRFKAIAHTELFLRETCALLGREGWSITARAREQKTGALLIQAHAMIRCEPPASFEHGEHIDAFAVLVATSLVEHDTSYDGPYLNGYALGFLPGERAEGPLDEAGMADTIYACATEPFPDWASEDGFWLPGDFAHALSSVVLPVEEQKGLCSPLQ